MGTPAAPHRVRTATAYADSYTSSTAYLDSINHRPNLATRAHRFIHPNAARIEYTTALNDSTPNRNPIAHYASLR